MAGNGTTRSLGKTPIDGGFRIYDQSRVNLPDASGLYGITPIFS
jgi:hypothetical protein